MVPCSYGGNWEWVPRAKRCPTSAATTDSSAAATLHDDRHPHLDEGIHHCPTGTAWPPHMASPVDVNNATALGGYRRFNKWRADRLQCGNSLATLLAIEMNRLPASCVVIDLRPLVVAAPAAQTCRCSRNGLRMTCASGFHVWLWMTFIGVAQTMLCRTRPVVDFQYKDVPFEYRLKRMGEKPLTR